MENNHRRQIVSQKTDFNNHSLCHLPNIFKCCKCRKNCTIMVPNGVTTQNCLFCGTPNYVLHKNKL